MAGGLGGTALHKSTTRLSASLERYQPKIADNVKTRNPLLDFFMDKKKVYDGGTSVAVRFRYKKMGKLGTNQHVNAFNYYDRLTTQPSDTIKNGEEPWSNLNVPISISHEEKIENSGKKDFDLLKDGTELAMDSLSENMNDVLLGIAGGDQSKLPSSIFDIVSGTGAGTIAGLSKAANTWLYSQQAAAIGDAATNFLDSLTTGYNDCVANSPSKADHPDVIFTDQAVYEEVQKILPAYVEYSSNKNVDIGFPTLVYMAMKIQFDATFPLDGNGNHQALMLTKKYWEFAVSKQWNFYTSKFIDMLPEQAADVAQLITRWAVICNQPRTNWWGYGITT